MKFILAIFLLTAFSCNNSQKAGSETMQMPGAYRMLSQTVNDGKKDTTVTTVKQLKIYTGDYMMYANVNPADSVSGFGISTYSADTGTVIEQVIYNAFDSTANASPGKFTLLIEKMPKGYKQVIKDMESGVQKFTLTEEYNMEGTTVKSPMDGAWKAVKFYTITGKDTIENKIVQYKTYYDGHFIFGHTFTDSTNKLHTGMGYGTFEMTGANKLKENVTASNYYQIRGKSFDIDIVMNGTDEFKQTLIEPNGDTGVEIYQRLKK